MRELRHVRIDNRFELKTWETGNRGEYGKYELGYCFSDKDGVIFEGEDFHCHAPIDTDGVLRSLLGFLTLRPGDTDPEYFENYTERQVEFAEQDAEEISLWAMEECEDCPVMPFENLDDWEIRC